MMKEGLTFQMNKGSKKTGGKMQDWPYAELTSTAKQMGGPQKMIETITSNARTEGRMDMIPWLGAAALIGAGAKWGYDKVKGYIDNRKKTKGSARQNHGGRNTWRQSGGRSNRLAKRRDREEKA